LNGESTIAHQLRFDAPSFLDIKVDEINAVRGIASAIPRLDARPLIVSKAMKVVEARW
jgi:hypothetical protein